MTEIKDRKRVMRPRWSKVLADLWDNKTRTILVVASIAVGVFALGTIANSYLVLSEDIDLSYASINPANIQIISDPFNDDFLNRVERIEGVRQAEGRHGVTVSVFQEGDSQQALNLTAINDFEDSQISQLVPQEGKAVPGEGEVLIGYEPMLDSGYRIGDVLTIQLPDDTLRQLTVSGIVKDQTAAGEFGAVTIGYIDFETLKDLGLPQNYNRLFATVTGDSENEVHIESIADGVEDQIEKSGRNVYRTTTAISTQHPFADMALAIFGVLFALGILVMLLTTSLIFNTLNALIGQHLRQIGMMKLVGGRSRQIMVMYMLLILCFSLLALAVAIPLSVIAGYGLAQMMAFFMKTTLQDMRLFPITMGIQIAVAIIVPLVAGFIPVRSGSQVKVRQALSNERPGDQPASGGLLDQLGKVTSVFSRPLLLSLRNTFRRKGRLLLTLFTLTISGAIFIAVFNVQQSMEDFMTELQQHFIADISLNLEKPYRINEVEQELMSIPGVVAVEAWTGAQGEILDENGDVIENLAIIGPPADSPLLAPDLVTGRWMLPEDENAILISDAIYESLPDAQPGDTLRITISEGREEDWTLVGVFRFMNMVGDPLSYAPYETISSLQNQNNKASSYRLVTTDQTSDGQRRIGSQIDQQFRQRGYAVGSIEGGAETQEQSAQMINVLIYFLLSMALLTAIVGSIGLTGTMGMNVLERTREIGVMRAIGAVDFAIVKSVVIEGAFIGFISWVLSVIFSFPISYLLLKIITESMFNAEFALSFTLDGILIWLGVVLVLSVIASVIPARSAARLTIREVLAYE